MHLRILTTILLFVASIFYFSMPTSSDTSNEEFLADAEALLLAKRVATEKGFTKKYRINEAKIDQVGGDEGHIYVRCELLAIPANAGLFLSIRINKLTKAITFSEDPFSQNAFKEH